MLGLRHILHLASVDGSSLWNFDPGPHFMELKPSQEAGGWSFSLEAAMIHKFQVGQSVIPTSPLRPSRNTYLVVRQLPPTSYEPQYWIQGVRSGLDCIVCESQIEAADDHRPRFSPTSLGAINPRAPSTKFP
jgi:hypothetical protein